MNRYLICLLVLLVTACSDYNNAKFSIENKSTGKIDSLQLSNTRFNNSNEKNVISINKNETKEVELNMENVQGDGNYTIRYKQEGAWSQKHFGYFTNGSQQEKVINIQIFDADSLIIK